MLSDWELWACASHYVKKHGEDAPLFVAMRIDELMEAGQLEGAKNFRAIVRRINQLLERPEGTPH
jgi:hypothetical protein